MVDLPPERVSASPPFTHVGIDVFGPWSVRTLRARGGVLHSKRWACIFCCFSSRAIHIEVIESMDTSSFINALRRFFSLRGPATDLYSDCGTNFIGACNEFRAWYGIESNREGVRTFLCTHNCTWHFNPPHASHMGGSWERPIGICRRILDGILSDASLSRLTHESLCTFLAEVVFIVNSRPLLPVSSNPECPFVFSPNILLTQKPPLLFEVPVSFDSSDALHSQWKRVQHLAQQFWDRWRRDYLPLLQPRRVWQQARDNVRVGDVVLLRDKASHRNSWPLGIIVQCFPGSDHRVRKVDIRLGSSRKVFCRPVHDIVLVLPHSGPPSS